jgi:hypothetical protein
MRGYCAQRGGHGQAGYRDYQCGGSCRGQDVNTQVFKAGVLGQPDGKLRDVLPLPDNDEEEGYKISVMMQDLSLFQKHLVVLFLLLLPGQLGSFRRFHIFGRRAAYFSVLLRPASIMSARSSSRSRWPGSLFEAHMLLSPAQILYHLPGVGYLPYQEFHK